MKTFYIGPKNERFVAARCSLCGSAAAKGFLKSADYTFVRCRHCCLVYQNPQPLFADLKQSYAEDYFHYELENDRNFFNLMMLGLADIRFFSRPLGSFTGTRFLDIGCATGMLVAEMKKRGWQAQGLEICAASARYGIEKRGVDIFIGTLEEACYPAGHFAVIHFSHLIEHVPRPDLFLKEVYRVLAPGGTAIITTPNVDGFQAWLFKNKWRSAIADHLTLFSRQTLGQILEKTQFKLEKVQTWGGLAAGSTVRFLKVTVDKLAKRYGFGDVVLYEVSKQI